MTQPTERPQTAPAAQFSAQPAAYQAPRVTDLGAWQAVTLIYSVPFNGSNSFNTNSSNHY